MFDKFWEKNSTSYLNRLIFELEAIGSGTFRFTSHFFSGVPLLRETFGLGEAYMDGWWDCNDLDEFFFRLLGSKVDEKIVSPVNLIGNLVGFPNSMLPSASQITKNYEGLFIVED